MTHTALRITKPKPIQIKTPPMKLMICLALLLTSCNNTISDSIEIDDYEFKSLCEFGKEVKIQDNIDVINKIKNSTKIKGPVKGIDVKTMILVNKLNPTDSLLVIIYGKENKYFRIGDNFYQANESIFVK